MDLDQSAGKNSLLSSGSGRKRVKCRVRPGAATVVNQSLMSGDGNMITDNNSQKSNSLSSLKLYSQESNHGSPQTTLDMLVATG
jgi:hypothetical protein